MSIITPEQIRAARALLNWKQSDLAKQSGLSLPSINNIERHIGSPRLATLRTIQLTLQSAGISFIGHNGVQKNTDIFEMTEFQGDDFIQRLNDDLFSCMRSPDDIVSMFGIDDRAFPQYDPVQTLRYYEHQAKTGFTERALIRENDDFFLSQTDCYRWTLPQTIGLVPYYVYHDRVAMIMWKKKRVILIRSQDIADTFLAQFDFLWAQAKPIPQNSVNMMDDPVYRNALIKKAEAAKNKVRQS